MSKKRPTYTDEFRASAVLMLEAAGWPEVEGALARTARHLGIPAMTISRWAKGVQNPPPNQTVTDQKESMLDILDYVMRGMGRELKRRIDDGEVSDVALTQVATTMGISIDKSRLLLGQSTENNDTVLRIVYTNDWRAPTALPEADAPTDD